MNRTNQHRTIIKVIGKAILTLCIMALCFKPIVKLYFTFQDEKLDLIENVSEEDSEEEKVDDSEEFEKFFNDQQSGEYAYVFSAQVSYFKLQQLTLEFYPAVVSPPPELS